MITPGARKTKRLRISQVEPWKTLQQLPSHCPNWVVVSFRFPTILQNANCSTHFAGCTESLASNTWDRWRFFGNHGGFEMIQGCTGSLNIIACNNMLEFGNLNLNLSCKALKKKHSHPAWYLQIACRTCAFVFGSQVNQRRNKTILNNLCNIKARVSWNQNMQSL
jgi:hypothetical protein